MQKLIFYFFSIKKIENQKQMLIQNIQVSEFYLESTDSSSVFSEGSLFTNKSYFDSGLSSGFQLNPLNFFYSSLTSKRGFRFP